jgi:hypothetical protein
MLTKELTFVFLANFCTEMMKRKKKFVCTVLRSTEDEARHEMVEAGSGRGFDGLRCVASSTRESGFGGFSRAENKRGEGCRVWLPLV